MPKTSWMTPSSKSPGRWGTTIATVRSAMPTFWQKVCGRCQYCHCWHDRCGDKLTAMNTFLAIFAKNVVSRIHPVGSVWPHGRPGADIRHDADLRRVLRDL